MQQHPIPQNVTQYQFRLVGDMTLKQFLELALGLGLAYLFFASNLIFLFKWPLVILSILLGAGLAFFPIEDRPLDQWIMNFIKAIYAPTRFTWQKTNKIPSLFTFEPHQAEVVNTITKTIKAPTIAPTSKPSSDLSEFESAKLSSLESLFQALPTPPTPAGNRNTEILENTPVLKPSISVRKLSPITALTGKDLQTPKTVPVNIPKSAPPQPSIIAPEPTTNVIFAAPSAPTTHVAPTTTAPKKITLPSPPKSPNLVTGVLVDQNDMLVENAIVQIVSSDGIPARAMKTNSLGQFYTSTPLGKGTYIIEVDKAGVNFTPQQIIINDTILSPFELRAKV